jgi:hypothetical protein
LTTLRFYPTTRSVTASRPTTPLSEALDGRVTVTENGRRQRITRRELVIKQLVNKSAWADLSAIKQLTDIVQEADRSLARTAGARQIDGAGQGGRRAVRCAIAPSDRGRSGRGGGRRRS